MLGNRIVPAGLAPIAILGVTASGKSAVAMELARRRGDVELVSVDSMQVYRGLDIGTAKPSIEERHEIPHHGIDLVDPDREFDVSQFQAAVAEALRDIATRRRRAVLVGGTGLYLRAIVDALELPGRFPHIAAELDRETDTSVLRERLEHLDPVTAARTDPANRRRIIRALEVTLGAGRPFSSFGPGLATHPDSPVRMVGIRRDRTEIADRIRSRFRQQMADGLLDEVAALRTGPGLGRTASRALGYRELIDHLDRAASGTAPDLESTVESAIRNIVRFAVRQDRWFRRDPRIEWIEPERALDHLLDLASRLWDP